jgi:hypothetical protein
MNTKDIERLEKNSIYSIRVSDEQKNQVIKNYLIELNQQVIKNLKNKKRNLKKKSSQQKIRESSPFFIYSSTSHNVYYVSLEI